MEVGSAHFFFVPMSKTSKTELLEKLVETVLEGTEFELVHLEFVKEGPDWVLRVFIDHPQGVLLDHCESVSHLISERLDQDDPIEVAYQLEVSSPGIDRPLVKPAHFQKFVGSRVFVKMRTPVSGVKQAVGTLVRFEDETLCVQNENDGQELSIPRNLLVKATLKPHLEFS
ncbi:MAG: ribosome maturation factor RimP [Acidobacteria bacterium]|nr:ribosome maturation factor RimP [Acidobacteriota bacterium]